MNLLAQAPELNVPIPGLKLSDPIAEGGAFSFKFLGEYIVGIFDLSLVLIVLIAIIVIMAGGARYAMAAGNAAQVGSARDMISGAIIGVALAYGAYSILAIVNPDTVNFRPIALDIVEKEMYAGAPLSVFEDAVKSDPTLARDDKITLAGNTGEDGNVAKLDAAFEELVKESGGSMKTLRAKWKGKCLQFAHALIRKADSPKVTRSNQLHRTLPVVKDSKGNNAFAGMTLDQLGKQQSLKIGMVVHIKVNYNQEPAYKPSDNFHHWLTYVGRDSSGTARFSHSFSRNHTGAQADKVMSNWYRSKIKTSKYKATKEWADANPGHPKQPTVYAVHVAF